MTERNTQETPPHRAMTALSPAQEPPYVRRPGDKPRNDIVQSTTQGTAWAAYGGKQPDPATAYRAMGGPG